ncbi:hypothetical protein CN900_00305 [Bacillus anthracis]|uniref:RHS repeat-associated core domain-containing protein n=1 Tax=Bacillus tropicus TaxID=2026188 RepID=A0A7T2V4K5_9BACI|nr:RHS repeat-associated core domain-containing protein [Bacillus tropicus]PEZ64893.1 hypothetical protein CN372_09060 [Bacillus anthracis]PFJ33422.1 hypothetical protein COI92_00065 [Bacillus anthracis]PGK00784.1 hypothetical protein CN900_00305 [Bacillus anthracis]QPR77346.1 RHS repeat-associated core domain-containing protein [Bacillus tropicus]
MSDEIKKTNSILQLLHGNVVAMTDQNREVVATYEYDSWGNVLKSDVKGIAADNPFGYAGYMYDKEIGMYYLIARYYNPVMMIDPDGHLAWFIPVAVHGARIAAPHVGRFVGKQLAKRAVKQPLKYKNTKAVAGKITGYTKHGINQAISRDGVGVSSKTILNAVKTGKKVIQSGGRTKYTSKQTVVVLNNKGKVITTFAKRTKYTREGRK